MRKKAYGIIAWLALLIWVVVYYSSMNSGYSSAVTGILVFILPIIAVIFSIISYKQTKSATSLISLIFSILLALFFAWLIFQGIVFK